jgi:hypothetical protein
MKRSPMIIAYSYTVPMLVYFAWGFNIDDSYLSLVVQRRNTQIYCHVYGWL